MFAPIAGGWFTMGTALGHEDERPPHRVFVDPFELGIYPVTRADYERFVSDTSHEAPCDWSHLPFTRADLPVVGVSWQDAVAYCAWRSAQDGRAVRLPTEATSTFTTPLSLAARFVGSCMQCLNQAAWPCWGWGWRGFV